MTSRFHLLATLVLTAVFLWPTPQASAQRTDDNQANSDIEQLAVGNYWTTKETKFTAGGEVDSEQFSTAIVVGRERIGGRTCYRMKRIRHDTPRFDPKLADTENPSDFTYYEYLDNGNLYYFERGDGADTVPNKTPATEAKNSPASPPPPRVEFTAENAALYLKYPADAGDIYQAFDTVGSVLAKDTAIKTPAGEFLCHVYGMVTDTSEAPHRSYTHEYWCPGIGFVKLDEFLVEGDDRRLIYTMELLAYHLEDGRSGGKTDDNGRRSKIENVH